MVHDPQRFSRRGALSLVASLGIGSIIASSGLSTSVAAASSYWEYPDVVLEWFGAWESDDGPGRISSLYTPDGTYADISAGASLHGSDIESFLKSMFAAAGQFQRGMRTAHKEDNYYIIDNLMTGFDPNGYDFLFQIYSITLFEIEGDKIAYSADYYDSGSILIQLGAIPAAPWFDAANIDRAGIFCAKSG